MKKLTYLVLLATTITACNIDVKPTLKSSYLEGNWWTIYASGDSVYTEIHFTDTTATFFNMEYDGKEVSYNITEDNSEIIFIEDTIGVNVYDENTISWQGLGGEVVLHRITDSEVSLSDFRDESYEKLALIQQMRANRYIHNKEVGTDTIYRYHTHVHFFEGGDTLFRDNQDIIHRMYKQDGKLIYEKVLFDVSDYVEGETNWYDQLKGREEELAKVLIREELPEI